MMVEVAFRVIGEDFLTGHGVQDWLVDCWGANSVPLDIVVLVGCISNRRNIDRRLICEPAVRAEGWTVLIKGAGEAVLPHLVQLLNSHLLEAGSNGRL